MFRTAHRKLVALFGRVARWLGGVADAGLREEARALRIELEVERDKGDVLKAQLKAFAAALVAQEKMVTRQIGIYAKYEKDVGPVKEQA